MSSLPDPSVTGRDAPASHVRPPQRWWLFACAWWLFVFGMWPAADPGHSLSDGILPVLDLLLHVLGLSVVVAERRRTMRGASA